MRIEDVRVTGLRNLQDFSVHFEDSQFTSVLIGENGTGKSNLLEAIVRIFRDLDLGERPDFGFEITYHCRGQRVRVIGTPGTRQTIYVGPAAAEKRLTWKAFNADKEELLPKYVFAYYSGPSTRMQHYFDRHQKIYYDALLRNTSGEAVPIRRLFYCQPEHSRWVLLAYFLHGTEPPEFLHRYFEIDAFDSALLVLRKPEWAPQGTPSGNAATLGDQRFWWAKGTVKSFLQRLWDQSMAPIYAIEEYVPDYRAHSIREERLYLFLPGVKALQKLNTKYDTEAALFAALESTEISQLVRDVRVRVIRDGEPIYFSEMSEGEQQLLTVVGLMQFTRHEESLFLLDEPDTHLNPMWKLRYLTELARQSGLLAQDGDVDGSDSWLDQTSQLILTTHDPLTIAGLKRMQVQIFERTSNGKVVTRIPDEDPQGMGVAGVLIQMFGLPSTLDTITQGKIDERNRLSRISERTQTEEAAFQSLTSELNMLGLVYEARDPEYREYLKALHAWEEERRTRVEAVSPEEKDEHVRAILDRLMEQNS